MENQGEQRQHKVVSFVNREELDFLDDLAKDIYFKYGLRIPRAKLIEEIIEAFKEKEKDTRGVLIEDLMRRFKDKKGVRQDGK